MSTTSSSAPGAASAPFVITRVFDAPRPLVWAALTQREHLLRWMGPAGCPLSECTVDLRPGGVMHYGMSLPNGAMMWGKWIFLELTPPERLVVLVSFCDEKQALIRHPMAATWPLQTRSITTLTEHEGKTTMSLVWSAYEAAASEQATFDGAHGGMTQGWTGTMNQLAAYLATL